MSTEPDLAQRLLEDVIMGSRAPHTQVVKVSHEAPPPAPTPPWHIWLCAGFCVIAAILTCGSLWVAADTRAEIRAERLSREIMNRWTAQEVTAIRSYITTGKLAPMNPPPTTTQQEPSP